MGCIRPATPGFIVTLVAAALLAVVSFCVPYFKSVYFLKATIEVNNVTGSVTFGTLGYCLDVPNIATNCSKPSIGYELDINSLVGNELPIQIPQVAVKWITYALFLHVVALILATGSAVFGLLAHVREMSMTCCSTCVSGFAAVVAMLAFIFDLVLFFVAKARINAVGKAEMGNAIWLTLAAWLLLFFSGCFYTLGRCCISKRPRGSNGGKWAENGNAGGYQPPATGNGYAEQMRLDAVKAEADRKARAKVKEGGLPAFSSSETQPLTARIEGDHVYLDGDDGTSSKNTTVNSTASGPGRKASQNTVNSRPAYAGGGYVQGAPGNRAVDEYYNPTQGGPNTYPPHAQSAQAAYGQGSHSPHPQRQGSGYQPSRQASGYLPSSAPPAGGYGGGYASTSPPPMPSQSLAVPGGYSDPYAAQGQGYGHTHGGSSYHTAAGHSQQPTAYSQYDGGYDQQPTPFTAPPNQQNTQFYSPQPGYNSEPPTFLAPGLGGHTSPPPSSMVPGGYNAPTAMNTGYSPAVSQSPPQQYGGGSYTPQQGYGGNERQYTIGGDGYGASSVPPLQDNAPAYDPYNAYTPQHQDGAVGGESTPRGPRPQPTHAESSYVTAPEEAPPGYDAGGGAVTGRWGKQ